VERHGRRLPGADRVSCEEDGADEESAEKADVQKNPQHLFFD
jgi:hypothetical protein